MRDYSKVAPRMWHGQTMKDLRDCPEAVIVAMYLMTSPSSNMLGLFSQPILYIAHETGLGLEGATKGLQRCIEGGFCSYDWPSESVWVHEMAAYQIAPELKATDLRVKGIAKDYANLPESPFLGPFFDRYASAFHLTERREFRRALEAPCKPLRSQEQEQEQEQERESSSEPRSESPPLALVKPTPPPVILIPLVGGDEHPVMQTDIDEWREAYPAVDVLQQLRQLRQWCLANPARRKTPRGARSFIVRWLGRVQDRGGSGAGEVPAPQRKDWR